MEVMKVSEAIIKVLEEEKKALTTIEIFNKIKNNGYVDFSNYKYPENTVNRAACRLIEKEDTRFARIKNEDSNSYTYFLTKYKDDVINSEPNYLPDNKKCVLKKDNFHERDLHPLLCTYLKDIDINSKTIYHEKSKEDANKNWVHPDMIGVQLIDLEDGSIGKKFLTTINKNELFKLYSYEIKIEIKNDSDLKQAYFQAVSNSSWANYGYLVAFEIADKVKEEIKRLNESFGIGVIKLSSNPYQCDILFPSNYRKLDIKTIDKLCKLNGDFSLFIEQIEKLLSAEDKHFSAQKNEFDNKCDKYLTDFDEVKKYCEKNNIPMEDDLED